MNSTLAATALLAQLAQTGKERRRAGPPGVDTYLGRIENARGNLVQIKWLGGPSWNVDGNYVHFDGSKEALVEALRKSKAAR